jgi:uncharacterized DUF497 family protein
MELDLIDTKIDLMITKPHEIEEVLEDPFVVKFIPDTLGEESRYFIIGQTIAQRLLFLCFNTDGKKAQIIAARDASEEETMFYQRNYNSFS